MSVFNYSYSEAANNFNTSPYSRWFSNNTREEGKIYMPERLGGIFKPHCDFNPKIKRSSKIFTIGSCFARGLERAAHRAGMTAVSRDTRPFFGEDVVAGFVNRYNTAAIANELRWASGEEQYSDDFFVETSASAYIDPHSHPIIAAMPLDKAKDMRSNLSSYFAQAFDADVITITLGLIESWYDKKAGSTLNLMPAYGRNDNQGRKLIDGDRFEFQVMSFEENMRNLQEIYRIIRANNPDCQIVVTVSPVPLSATFSHRDVSIANMMSKSTLRTCAESWIGIHPEIQYFPSYEMAVMSDPSIVYQDDGIHIQDSFVKEIMAHFMRNCVEIDRSSC